MNMLINNFNRCLIISTIFILLSINSNAQGNSISNKEQAGEYSLVLYTGGGISYYTSKPGVPEFIDTKTSRVKICETIRIMWHPDHLLRLGIETGYIPFYSYTIIDNNLSGDLKFSAIPILLEWSMPVTKRLNVFIGYGYYKIISTLDFAGKTESSTWNTGWAAATSYIQPISKDLGIAFEVKWMESARAKNTVIISQLQLVWKFFKW